jgi:hypothetical protein
MCSLFPPSVQLSLFYRKVSNWWPPASKLILHCLEIFIDIRRNSSLELLALYFRIFFYQFLQRMCIVHINSKFQCPLINKTSIDGDLGVHKPRVVKRSPSSSSKTAIENSVLWPWHYPAWGNTTFSAYRNSFKSEATLNRQQWQEFVSSKNAGTKILRAVTAHKVATLRPCKETSLATWQFLKHQCFLL